MTKYFVAKIWFFDPEEYQTAEEVRQEVEGQLDEISIRCEGLVWEEVQAKEVELEEYKKED